MFFFLYFGIHWMLAKMSDELVHKIIIRLLPLSLNASNEFTVFSFLPRDGCIIFFEEFIKSSLRTYFNHSVI